MSTTTTIEATKDVPQGIGRTPDEFHSASSIWIARAVIVSVAGALAWYTWGHWGDFQIDTGRELYVPAEILKGKLLFRDLWYMYGPLAPYLKALLFWIFGVHLTVLYLFGLTLTIGTALLTFEVSRFFNLGPIGSTVPALFFLVEAFYPFIRNFVFPYSYAASLAAFLGLACLYFVLRHASSGHTSHLALAALLASLVILTKQEFGVACLALLGFELAAHFLTRRSWHDLLRNSAVCIACLLPAVAGYGWFVWKLSARLIFFENWISTPGTYFMQTFGKITIPEQGLRFVPSEILEAAEFTVLGVALWALIAIVAVSAIRKLGLSSRPSMALSVIVSLSPLWIAVLAFVSMFPWRIVEEPSWVASFVVIPLTQAIFPKGIFLLVVLFSVHALWKLVKGPANTLAIQEVGFGIYAALVALRQMMELRPELYQCAVFFNGAVFIVFTILLYRIFRWACRTLDAKRGDFVVASLLIAETCLLSILFFPTPQLLPAKLTTDYGSFYTRYDVAVLFPQIISFMKTHTQNKRDILVLPEPPSLYVFAGMDAPSRWYSLMPGYLAPDQEQEYINELTTNQVRYILITHRRLSEYKILGFLNGGYNQTVYRWIMDNYTKVGQFGPEERGGFPPYIVSIFEKKDLAQAANAAQTSRLSK